MEVKYIPWPSENRVWVYAIWLLQIRPAVFTKRISLLPFVDIDWDLEMITLEIGWLNFEVAFDWNFGDSVDWSGSERRP